MTCYKTLWSNVFPECTNVLIWHLTIFAFLNVWQATNVKPQMQLGSHMSSYRWNIVTAFMPQVLPVNVKAPYTYTTFFVWIFFPLIIRNVNYVCRQKYMIKINVRVCLFSVGTHWYVRTVVRVHGTEIRMFVVLLQSDRLAGSQVGKWTVHTTPPNGRHGSADLPLYIFIFTRHCCRHPPPLPPSPSAPVIASAILRRHSCLGCPRNKQTKNFGSNRNKPKQDLFQFFLVCLVKQKTKKGRFVSVLRTYIETIETSRTVSKQSETNRNNPKFS